MRRGLELNKIEQAKTLLKEKNQLKTLKLLENLNEEKKEQLAKEILKVDFEQIDRLYNNKDKRNNREDNIEPIKYIDKNKLNSKQRQEVEKLGEKVFRQNQYAVVTMAGGQGTRLGWKGPKGTFKLDVDENGKYIFEILANTLKSSTAKYGKEVYWYIMTSIDNNDETVSFFEKHNYFGYNKQKVKFFTQNILPILDFEGNLLIDSNYNVKEASDGNGGVFVALKNSKMIEDMKLHNIKWIYVCGVDNIMANMTDEVLLGLAIKNNVPSASKSIKKAYPEEKVGIFCKKNGKPAIIEYTEMDKKMIYAEDENGELLYGESNIVGHLFNIDTLEKMAEYKFDYHCAKKKNSYLDENLKEVIPDEPNTLKFEAFIFDGFEYLEDMVILRVNREEEFAPIKNETGVDSPETAKEIYEKYYNKGR